MADPDESQPLGKEPASSGVTGTAGLEGRAGEAREALWGMLSRMGIEADIRVTEDSERICLDVVGSEAGLVIGKKGQTLDSLQPSDRARVLKARGEGQAKGQFVRLEFLLARMRGSEQGDTLLR